MVGGSIEWEREKVEVGLGLGGGCLGRIKAMQHRVNM